MSDADPILIVKTGALGDVLRTTAILPGLFQLHPGARVTWVVAPNAAPLVEGHSGLVDACVLDTDHPEGVINALAGRRFSLVVSLDEEEVCCQVAGAVETDRFVGAYLDESGEAVYTDDACDWFDMSMISRFGKQRADELKVKNKRTHPELLASMLGIEEGRPELQLTAGAKESAARRWEDGPLSAATFVVGLNTGSGCRWASKRLDEARTIATALELSERSSSDIVFLVLGGPDEDARNARIHEGLLAGGVTAVQGGAENTLHEFAALVSRCDLVITSDSLCLHVAVARRTPVVAFFAPTSAAEIELYGLGQKVVSTASDACSYRPDADNSTITPERLATAAARVLEERSMGAG